MSYTGYNVEDAILINKGSVDRGMFRTLYYTSYESREENAKVSGSTVNSFFANIESKPNVSKQKEGFDYSKLDEHGLVKEHTPIDDKTILIGQVSFTTDSKGEFTDNSVTTKKGQLGFVDKSFVSEGEEGFRIAKVRICEERLPAIGDKFASRSGQKGTIGLVVPEEDMPFTPDGVRPDLIINPHALPSRMTIGQLIECLFGKACVSYGAYGDCTAYSVKGANCKTYGEMLTEMNFHSSGNQILYNGFTGEQIYSEIYIGPTYYMRLKHMVKDKINYRATGKRSALTRQTNQGRSNDGGLKIGEMERDGIMGHGLSYFLNESYMVRGDQYYMAVCNKTGTIAIYNPNKNLFISPFSDGPLVFNKSVEGEPVLDVFSKFGRSFSILRVPYALKLLIQELQVLNVQMRIITEENVDQLLNLSYQSRNIDKLLHTDNTSKSIKETVQNYKIELDAKIKAANDDSTKFLSKNVTLKQNITSDVTPQVLDSEAAAMRRREQQERQEQQQGQQGEDFDLLGWDVTQEQQKQRQQQQPMEDDSPDYGPPDVITGDIRSKWAGLTKQQRDEILSYPEEMQQGILWQVVNNKPRLQRPQMPVTRELEPLTQEQLSQPQTEQQSSEAPNFEDETLQRFFAQLPKEEQIELLKLSHERQLDKLKEMSKAQEDSQKLTIVIPKTASEELYGGSLSLLAPVSNTHVTDATNNVESVVTTGTTVESTVSGGGSDATKKIITFN
jgi:hypothetical protein